MVVFIDVPLHFRTQFALASLLRKNILERALSRPAGHALPHTPGEAISRLRGDVDGVVQLLMEVTFQVGTLAFAVAGGIVMAGIDPLLTALVFIPLAGVVVVVRFLRQRITTVHERFRRDTGHRHQLHRRAVRGRSGAAGAVRRGARRRPLPAAQRPPPARRGGAINC